MTVVALDGIDTIPYPAKTLNVACGQRYDVIINGKSKPKRNYAIIAYQPDAGIQANGQLRYERSWPDAKPMNPVSIPIELDDMAVQPLSQQAVFDPPHRTINFPVWYTGRRIFLGSSTYVSPKVPTLYTALTTGQEAMNPAVYGPSTNPHVLGDSEVVQIVVQNDDGTEHPMHLHGHHFQVIARGPGQWDGHVAQVPMQRDTVNTPAWGHLVLRFRADNPGVWLCK